MTNSRVARVLLVLVVLIIVLLAAMTAFYSPHCQVGTGRGYLHSFHGRLVDASGCQVHLTGVNWVGFETSAFAPHGLETRNWQEMLDQIKQAGFNTLRLPYSNQLFDPSSQPQGINYQLNPDLKGLHGLALLDRIIQGASRHGLRVIFTQQFDFQDLAVAEIDDKDGALMARIVRLR